MSQALVPDGGQPTADAVTGDPDTILSRVPRDAQLFLRDYIAGLEAQAGSARAEAERLRRTFKVENDRLLLMLAGARSERDAAIAERDSLLRALSGWRAVRNGLLRSGR